MAYIKVYVAMVLYTDTDGNSKPVELEWADGTRFKITKVLDKRFAPPEYVGSSPAVRYCVLINGRQKLVYYEKFSNKWFVEKQIK